MSLDLGARQVVESLSGVDLVQLSSYGPTDKTPDVVLLSPHAGKSRQLVDRMGGSFDDDPGIVDDYLNIDADFGADALAHEIANQISQLSGDLRVDVVQVLFERGIVDPNRITGLARRNVIDFGQISKHENFLKMIHLETLRIINKILSQIDENKGLFLDIHSMAPYTPKDLIAEYPGRLKTYNYYYREKSQRGARRHLDLITDIPGRGMIANPIVFRNVYGALTDNGESFRQNNPYPLANFPSMQIVGTKYMIEHAGLTLDYPKDRLTKGEAESENWDIANLEVDDNKVEYMAKIIAGAVIQSLREIRS